MQVYPNGTYGVVRNSKDVIFDTTIDFKDVNTIFPEDTTFEEYCIGAEPPLQLPQCSSCSTVNTRHPTC
jgi:hypothetical protein